MKHVVSCMTAVLCLSLTVGCGTVGKEFNSSQVRSIQKTVTTKADILNKFGAPFKEGKQDGFDTWTYQFDSYKLVGKNLYKDLVVLFDKNGVVQAYRYTSSDKTR
ncbi:MAG: hypothetical protein ACE5GQ_00100 [Nitrospinales bacterium]